MDKNNQYPTDPFRKSKDVLASDDFICMTDVYRVLGARMYMKFETVYSIMRFIEREAPELLDKMMRKYEADGETLREFIHKQAQFMRQDELNMQRLQDLAYRSRPEEEVKLMDEYVRDLNAHYDK